MRLVINAIEGEFRRYKSLAEGALAQLSDEQLRITSGDGNSVATLVQHLGGNLQSRFTGFLDHDGEKPWRNRDAEFEDQLLSRDQLVDRWENGWRVLFETLGHLTDEQLGRDVVIRGVSLSAVDAISRSVTHASYHVGQIVLIARAARGAEWSFLSIPPGGSAGYTADPGREKPPKPRGVVTEIVITTHIEAPRELCFDLACDVAVHAESATFSGERLVAPGKLEGLLDVGDLVCFEGRHFGLRQRFCARITVVERPDLFIDEMVEGIFSWLRHDHEFAPSGSGTLMIDRLTWKAPLGVIGSAADAIFLKRHMTWFVRTKQSHLKAIAERRAR